VGSFTSDNSGCLLRATRSARGESCFTVTFQEGSGNGCASTEGLLTLNVPPGVDYDLIVTPPSGVTCMHRSSTGTFVAGCTGNNASEADEAVWIGNPESCIFGLGDGVDQTFTVTVEVRWFAGGSCTSWTLDVSSGGGC
jgi:hypothetical protein